MHCLVFTVFIISLSDGFIVIVSLPVLHLTVHPRSHIRRFCWCLF